LAATSSLSSGCSSVRDNGLSPPALGGRRRVTRGQSQGAAEARIIRDERTKQWVESLLAPIVERHPVAAETEPELGLRPPGFVEPLAWEPVGGGDHEHLPDCLWSGPDSSVRRRRIAPTHRCGERRRRGRGRSPRAALAGLPPADPRRVEAALRQLHSSGWVLEASCSLPTGPGRITAAQTFRTVFTAGRYGIGAIVSALGSPTAGYTGRWLDVSSSWLFDG